MLGLVPARTARTEPGQLDAVLNHYVLDDGKSLVAHAGMNREFALFGETTGETDEFGLPVRHNWAAEYRDSAIVVYGYTPVPLPKWLIYLPPMSLCETSSLDWWQEVTARGGGGMVVKPMDFILQGRRGLAQPAVKCRGQE